MGCGASTESGKTSPVIKTLTRIDSDCWMYYPPSRPDPENFSCSSVSAYSFQSTYERACSYWDSEDTGRSTPVSTISPMSTSSPDRIHHDHLPATPQSTPVLLISPGCTHEYPPHTPQSTPTQRYSPRRSGSSATYTNRTYSLLSTPNFHSSSSHPRNDLTLDPDHFTTPPSPKAGQCATKIDTDCASRFSDDRSPTPVHRLTLDPSLFSNHLSPFAEAKWRSRSKIDTDGASRFPSTDESLSPSFASPVSLINKRYPMTPLSVRTEPFPRR